MKWILEIAMTIAWAAYVWAASEIQHDLQLWFITTMCVIVLFRFIDRVITVSLYSEE